MRPLGQADTSLLVPSAGSGTSFRAGVFVSLRVEERLEPGLYRLRSGALSFTVRSAAELPAGATLRARVEFAKPALAGGEGLVLRLLPELFGAPDRPGASGPPVAAGPPGATATLARLGLPADPSSRLALAALLSEGLKVEPASLQRLRRAILRAPAGAEGERAELAAVLEGKGLAATEAAVEALAAALDSGRDGGGAGQGGGDADEGGAGEDGPRGEGGAAAQEVEAPGAPSPKELESGFERLLDEEELPAVLASFLEALVRRSSPDAGILGLANHARGREGSWVMLPFRFSLDSVAFRGSLRILFPSMPGGPGRLEARFSAGLSAATASSWGFSLAMGGTARPRLRIFPGARLAEAQGGLAALAKALESRGCLVELAEADAEWGAGGLAAREGVAFDA